MRDIYKWRKKLCKALRDSDDLKNHVASNFPNADEQAQREVMRLAQLIAEVELGLTLLRVVAPEEPATSVEALLKGYRFPVKQLQSDLSWQLVQKARFYLILRKGRQWLRALEDYINKVPEILKIYQLENVSDVPQLIPSSTYTHRLQKIYLPTLLTTPKHKKRKIKLATEGRWFCKISQNGNSPLEVPIDIPKAVANIAPSPQVLLVRTRTKDNPPLTVTFGELLLEAHEMDRKLSESGLKPHYLTCLQRIALQLYDAESDNFCPGTSLKLERLVHIVGLLNVGKSTLLEVLIYHLAKQKYRCALIVNDVATAVRIASVFSHQLGIPAAPVLGSNRAEQLEKVYEPILKSEGKEVTEGAMHPARRWFSPVCPLVALVQSEDKWAFGQEPCHNLYQKFPGLNNGNPDADDEDSEERESKEHTCLFYYKCPRHHLEQDIATALVWVLTSASFIKTRVPRQIFEEDLTFAEAVYRECNFLFIDEADRVQKQFDEYFAPDEVLVDGSGNSFLNKLGLNLATIYNSDRSNMAADRFVAWTSAHYYAQNATNRIYHRLLTQPKLVEWLGKTPFTGRSLFARIIRDLFEQHWEENGSELTEKPQRTRSEMAERRRRIIAPDFNAKEQRERRKEIMDKLDGFLQNPLNRSRGGELSDLAFTLLSTESDRQALAEVAKWCRKWLETNHVSLPDETDFEELTRNTHFAILITVLDNRLGFLVDNLLNLSQVIDLHDLSEALLHRPPRDYLPVLPESPVGNILGFLYKPERRSIKQAGKLDYFRYVGVGRALLLRFPELFAVDEWDGPHTVLISGTSYAPGSPTYHISIEPTVLLQPATDDGLRSDAGIEESEFFFSPKQRLNGTFIALSGLPLQKRKLAAEDMVKAMCYSPGRAPSFLDEIFQELKQQGQDNPDWWGDRERILISTGSYDEAEWSRSILQPSYRLESEAPDGIVTLRRDQDPDHWSGIPRSKIQDLKNTSSQIVFSPLMAMERAVNILNAQGKAAFGAVLFLNRPMPVPDDWQSTVQQLNAWALAHEQDSTLYEAAKSRGEILTLTKVGDIFYQNATAEMLNLNCTAWSFKQLTQEERSVLCWTQLVSIWQIIGRLVRGGVPAKVHFMDVKFAPKSANGDKDSEITSLLVGIIKVLEPFVEGEDKRPVEKTLARSLYGAFLNALKRMKERNLNFD